MLGYSFKRGQITRLRLRAGARLKYSSVGWRGKGQNKCYGITMDNVRSYTSRPPLRIPPPPPRILLLLLPLVPPPLSLSPLHSRFLPFVLLAFDFRFRSVAARIIHVHVYASISIYIYVARHGTREEGRGKRAKPRKKRRKRGEESIRGGRKTRGRGDSTGDTS